MYRYYITTPYVDQQGFVEEIINDPCVVFHFCGHEVEDIVPDWFQSSDGSRLGLFAGFFSRITVLLSGSNQAERSANGQDVLY